VSVEARLSTVFACPLHCSNVDFYTLLPTPRRKELQKCVGKPPSLPGRICWLGKRQCRPAFFFSSPRRHHHHHHRCLWAGEARLHSSSPKVTKQSNTPPPVPLLCPFLAPLGAGSLFPPPAPLGVCSMGLVDFSVTDGWRRVSWPCVRSSMPRPIHKARCTLSKQTMCHHTQHRREGRRMGSKYWPGGDMAPRSTSLVFARYPAHPCMYWTASPHRDGKVTMMK